MSKNCPSDSRIEKLYAILFNAMLDISKAYVEEDMPLFPLDKGKKCYESETVSIAVRAYQRFKEECDRLTSLEKQGNTPIYITPQVSRKIDHLSIGLFLIAFTRVHVIPNGKRIVEASTTKDLASMFLKNLETINKGNM